MAWLPILPTEIRVTARERQIIAEQAENPSTLEDIISGVAGEVAGYVGTKFPVGPDGTFPGELREAAKSVIVLRFVTQIPSDDLATETRQKAAAAGVKAFEAVPLGKLRIADPALPAPVQSTPGIETITPGNHGQSREDLSRL